MPIVIGSTAITGTVLWSTAHFVTSVNGVPGSCEFRYRDDSLDASFTVGQPLALEINGQAIWRGFVSQVSRVYAFPAENVYTPTERWFDIKGFDLNILFNRRVIFRKSNPANTYGTFHPAGTHDDVVIADLIANFLDLSGDGLDTTSYVDYVSTPDPAQPFRVNAGVPWGVGMSQISAIPGAIWYLDPDANFVYTDVDTISAPFGLSDVPNNITTVGYSNMEVLFDGANLANDVMAWGYGYGSQTPVFDREQDSASQTEHGLWQAGNVYAGVYKQTTIDRIAQSILDGSPTNHRGHKDDRHAIMVRVRQPGFRAGQKVAFTSNVFGYTETLPVRKLEVEFEGPSSPYYSLTLSHEIDPDWSMFDPYNFTFPAYHRPKPPVIQPVIPVDPVPCPNTFDATTYIDYLPHFWQGSVSFSSGFNCAGQGYSIDNGRMLTGGISYSYSVTATLVVGATGPNFGRFQFGEGVAVVFPCGVAYYGPNNVEETIGPFAEGETHTGSFTPGGEAGSDFMYCFFGADHQGETAPFGHGEFWVDPPGWVPPARPEPDPGDCVINDQVLETPDGSLLDYTLYLGAVVGYCPGSLIVYVDNVQTTVVETDPTLGEFSFLVAPLAGSTIIASYVAYVDGSACPSGLPPDSGGGPGSQGYGETAIMINDQTYQIGNAYVVGSTTVYVNGAIKIRGASADYIESNPGLGQIYFESPLLITDVVQVTYIASGSRVI